MFISLKLTFPIIYKGAAICSYRKLGKLHRPVAIIYLCKWFSQRIWFTPSLNNYTYQLHLHLKRRRVMTSDTSTMAKLWETLSCSDSLSVKTSKWFWLIILLYLQSVPCTFCNFQIGPPHRWVNKSRDSQIAVRIFKSPRGSTILRRNYS